MDIYFILDSSSSIYVKDYEKELDFTRAFIGKLDVRRDSCRVGALTYSEQIQRAPGPIELTRNSDKRSMMADVNLDQLPYLTGITNTDQAIRYVREQRDVREGITKVMVVVTDGESRSPGATANEARLARENGWYMIVVGVGQYTNQQEWNAIATDPNSVEPRMQFVYNISTFTDLLAGDTLFTLPPRVCDLPPLGNCNVQQSAELMFVAGPGGEADAFMVIEDFQSRTRDDRDDLRVSYFMGACDGSLGRSIGESLEDVACATELAGTQDATENSYISLLNQLEDYMQNSASNSPRTVVLFMDSETMNFDSRYDITSKVSDLRRQDNMEVVVVDLGVDRRYSRFMARGDRLVSFRYGSIVAQADKMFQFTKETCEAVNTRGTGGGFGGIDRN